MQLTKQEERMVARMRKKQKQWLRWRWFMLFTGLFLISGAVYIFTQLKPFIEDPTPSSLLILASFIPQLYIFCAGGGAFVGLTWFNWNGNPCESLLLKLVDDRLGKGDGNPT
jgi:hypothetical protein